MRNLLLAGTALAAVLTLASAAQAAEQSPTIVKLMTSDVAVDASGLDTRTVHMEITATNEAAAMDVGQTSLPYRESMQELEVIEAYTQKANGDRLPVAANAIYTQQPQSAPQLQAFDDVRRKVIVFPNVAAGDSIVYTARWRDKVAAIPGHFTYSEFYSPSVPYNEARGSITAPKNLALKIENHGVQVEKQETADTVTYRWRYSAPADDMVDFPQVSPLDSLPRVLVSSIATHDELGRVYASLLAPKEAVTPRIQALADQVTTGIADRRLQAQKIYEWVSKNIRYIAVDIGNGGIIPHEADVTLANGYGDCKDHAVLFAALLKAKGIASEVALINLGNAYTLPDVAMILPFNHVITWLPEFQLYVDTTAGVAPFGTLPFAEYGKPVVHAVASGGGRRQTPVLPRDVATVSLKTLARVAADGKVSGESTVAATGPFALSLRSTGLTVQGSGPARYATASLESQGVKGTGFVDVPPPTELAPAYTLKSRFEYTDNDISSGVPFQMIRGLWLSGVTGDLLMGSLFDEPQNENEATACYSGRAEEELSAELPAGTPIGGLPSNFEIKTPNLEFKAIWSSSGSTVTVHREFISSISEPLCSGEIRKATAKALDQIRDHYNLSTVSYSPGQASITNIDPDIEAATTAYDDRDYTKAVEHFSKALSKTELGPEFRLLAHTYRGDSYNFLRDYQRAIVDYTESLRLKPDQANVLNARGAVFAATQQYDKAVADFTQAIRVDPNVQDYYSGRASAFRSQGKLREAAEDYGAIIRLKPNDQLAYVNRARAYETDGLYERTIADCDSVIRLGRRAGDCYGMRATSYYVLGRFEEAQSDFSTAIQAEPNNPSGYFGRGLVYLASDKPEQAVSDFDAALRLRANDPRSLYGRAVAKERLGNQSGAEIDLASARRIDPNMALGMSGLGVIREPYTRGKDDLELCKAAGPNRDIRQGTLFCSRALSTASLTANDKAMAHVYLAGLHRQRRHFEEAQTHYDEALRLTPNSASLYVERGLSYRENDDLDHAIEDYTKALAIDPNLSTAYFNRALAYSAKGDNGSALRDYEQALMINPKALGSLINLGNVYQDRGQYEEAMKRYAQALEISPTNPVLLSNRCLTLTLLGKPREALSDCNRAIGSNSRYPNGFVSRGFTYLRMQNYSAAIEDYDEALRLDPRRSTAFYGRGVAKLRLGNAAEGNADIAEAVSIDPQVTEKMAKIGVTP